jgi:hypothetical protein
LSVPIAVVGGMTSRCRPIDGTSSAAAVRRDCEAGTATCDGSSRPSSCHGTANARTTAATTGTEPSTTAGYVKRLGRRPEAVAKRAATVLDGQAHDDPGAQGSESPADSGSNLGSNGTGPADSAANDGGP